MFWQAVQEPLHLDGHGAAHMGERGLHGCRCCLYAGQSITLTPAQGPGVAATSPACGSAPTRASAGRRRCSWPTARSGSPGRSASSCRCSYMRCCPALLRKRRQPRWLGRRGCRKCAPQCRHLRTSPAPAVCPASSAGGWSGCQTACRLQGGSHCTNGPWLAQRPRLTGEPVSAASSPRRSTHPPHGPLQQCTDRTG